VDDDVEGIDGSADGVVDHDDIKGSQTGLATALLDPSLSLLKYTPLEPKMKQPFGKLPLLTVNS